MTNHTLSFPAAGKWVTAFLVAHWVALPPTNRAALVTLLIFMGFDLFTGIWAAAIEKKICSEEGLRGVSKKIGIMGLLVFCHLLEDRVLHTELNLELAGAFGYTLNEAISIVENFARIGVDIPEPLVEALMKVKHLRLQKASPEKLKSLEETEKP